jgi:hypothetical protein
MTPSAAGKTSVRLARAVPIIGWLPRYEVSWLGHDAVVGFTI